MIDLDKIGLRYSLLTGNIYIARFGKDPSVAVDKRDGLNDFLHVLVQYIGDGNEVSFGRGDEQYVVTLRKVEGGATAAVSPAPGQRHEQAHEDKPDSGEGELKW